MESLELNSRGYYLGSSTSDFLLGATAADEPVPVASLTKIMTAYIALNSRKLDEEVTITPEMLSGLEEFAVVGLEVGQVATVEDLLYATMLPSAGDAAQALAISTSGSIEAFSELMNEAAEEIGMKNTHFSNPVGFDVENYSTPSDIAILLREALKNLTFVEIFETYKHELPSIGKTATKTFTEMSYVLGGKTGYTNAAGRCFASLAEVEGQRYILVTVGAPTEGALHLADAETVYQSVAENYEPVRIMSTGDTLVRLRVENSPVKALDFKANTNVDIALPNGTSKEDLIYSYEGVTEIRQDTEFSEHAIGTYTVKYGEQTLAQQNIFLEESCEGVHEYCVAMPEFYNYGWMALGGIISLGLLGLTIWSFVCGKQRLHKNTGKILKWVSLAALVISLVANALIFGSWFINNEATETYEPDLIQLTTEETPGEKPAETPEEPEAPPADDPNNSSISSTAGNCTTSYGNLMLINPNFTVGEDFIAARRGQLISVSQTYGIPEYHAAGNGDNLMIPEAAAHLNEMVKAYEAENPGHEIGTYSCFRSRGTSCGRLCAATGTSDHHTGLTCDLIDLQYGSVLNTDDYPNHKEWQWLRENSYKYGFIDRFPEAWAGGLMSEPLNVDANGSTGLFETWHYRYVGVEAATEIATGKYNNGRYDSLEHYLKATGRVGDLKTGICAR